MTKLVMTLVLVTGCTSYFGGDDVGPLEPDAAVIAPPDATTDAAPNECPPPPPDPHSCAALGCGASVGDLDCSRIEGEGAPCYCIGVIGEGWCFLP